LDREAPWSSGERQGLTIRATVLGRGLESQLHLKTRLKRDGPLDGRKNNKNNKDSQMGQVTLKNICKKTQVFGLRTGEGSPTLKKR